MLIMDIGFDWWGVKMSDPRRKEWDRTYREKHKEEIRDYRRTHGAEAELRRDPVKRAASRKRYYEKTKDYWIEWRRKKRQSASDWWTGVLSRIEDIANKGKV